MAIKEWATNYPTTQDVPATDQPDLVNGVDDTRVSQIHTLRDKLHSVAQVVGSGYPYSPSGCLREAIVKVPSVPVYVVDSWYTKVGPGYSTVKSGFMLINYQDYQAPPFLSIFMHGMTSAPGSYAHIRLTITPTYGGNPPIVQFASLGFGWYEWFNVVFFGLSGYTQQWYLMTIELENDTVGETATFNGLVISRNN